MADDWQSLTELAATPATDDEVLVKDTSDTTDDAVGTVKRNSRSNFLGSILGATTASFTTADETKLDGIEALADVTDAANVAAAGAHMAGGTDVPVLDGGTGASTPAGARTNLELVVGTHVQAWDAQLDTWATVTPSANGQSLVAAANYGAMRGLLDLEAGTDFYSISAANAAFQPIDADLTVLSTAFTSAAATTAAALKLAEATNNGATGVALTGPTTSGGEKVVTFQDVTGTVYVSGGTDVPVADGGTGVSTLGSGNVLVGAGTSPITSAKVAPAGDFVGTTDTQTLSGKTINNVVLTGTVTVPDAALAIADTSGLQSALDLKAPLASPTFTGTVALPNDQISYAEMQNVAALSVVGNATNATADPAEITAGSDAHVLRRSGTTLGFGTVATAGIADAQVTYAKIQNVAGLSVVARSANTSGVAADVTAGTDGDVLRRSGTTLGFGAIPQASVTSLTADLALKAPLASPTFTTALTAANPTFTGTVTIPDGALAIADTSGLQTALDAKLPLAGGTVTGAIALGTGGSISDAGPISATGALTKATHGGRTVLTTGNVTIPNASGDVGMGGMIILGGAHTITFGSTVTAALANGDVFCYYVQSTTVLKRTLVPSAKQPAMT